MEKLPEDVMMHQILLKLPTNSLLNLRYVSKDLWRLITSPCFIKLHYHHSSINLLLICSRQLIANYKPVTHNYACNYTGSLQIVKLHIPFESTEIRASCNGLLYLHQRFISWGGIDGRNIDDIMLYYIWNPCTKEYKQLPPPPLGCLKSNYSSSSGFCGFGCDRNNDEYKILHYENRIDLEVESDEEIIEFKVYTLGTNSWTRISDDNNPYRSFNFTDPSKRTGLLVNGALHWTMSLSNHAPKEAAKKIISFDIEKEVFIEVQKPPRYYDDDSEDEDEDEEEEEDSLQILQECLCICKVHFDGADNKIDIWMLKDYDVMDSWTKLLRVVIPGKKEFNYYQFRLLRYCENGEIVMLKNEGDAIVYDPVNRKARCAKKFNKSIAKGWIYYMDYTESLVCLNSGTYTTDINGNGRIRHIDNTITDLRQCANISTGTLTELAS